MVRVHFITHPDVVVDPAVPVPEWRLSERGLGRMRALLDQLWVPSLRAVHCSTEQKALDGALVLADHLGLVPERHAALGENDRSSTGFLPPAQFERVADAFFASPETSIRGWETAAAAQQRIVGAVERILAEPTEGAVAIVSHGAVGTLLLCHIAGHPIDRRHDQPGSGGGNHFLFEAGAASRLIHGWRPIDQPAGDPA
jgi:broad specificity phosphatase PhoE